MVHVYNPSKNKKNKKNKKKINPIDTETPADFRLDPRSDHHTIVLLKLNPTGMATPTDFRLDPRCDHRTIVLPPHDSVLH